MPATTNVNFRTVVHEKSNGMAMFFPDVCKTPAPPAPFVPIPYPNIAMSTDTDKGSSKVKIDGCPVMLDGSNFKTSTGDEAGTAGGGILSSKTKGKAEFILFSFDVKIEGKGVPRLGDLMLGNKGGSPNTPPMPEIQGPLIMIPPMDQEETAKKWSLKKMETEDPDAEDETEEEGSGGGRAARKGGAAGAATGPSAEKKKVPTIKAKWSKKEIHPLHNKNETPSSPPTDDIPEECKVKLEVDTTEVPDGTAATIEIRHAQSGSIVKGGSFKSLIVKGNKVVDPKTNAPVEWTMDAEAKLWDPWDKPFYYFKAKVDYLDLKAETAKDFKAKEAECLRLVYWSACISDKVADDNQENPLDTQGEMNVIASILESQPSHKALKRVFKASDPSSLEEFKKVWGSTVRNSYVYHHGGHGAVQCAVNPTKFFACDADLVPTHCGEKDGKEHKGQGAAILIDAHVMTSAWLNDKNVVPSVPRYLAYFNCCQLGWERSLCDSFVKRGTRNVIAFKKIIEDGACVNLAMDFYDVWMNTHKGDPKKIPTVFFNVGASCYTSLRPVLYGKGGGSIPDPDEFSAMETAGLVIGAIASGLLIGIAAAGLIKTI